MAAKCFYHKRRAATGICVECGRMLCGQCDVTVKGKIYCNPCVEQMFGEQPAVVPAEVVEEAVSAEVEAVAATAETEAVETAAPPKAPGKKRTGVWVGLGVGLAFVFIVVPLLLLVIGALSDSDGNGKAKVIPGPGPEITIGRTGAITTGPMVEVANKAISTSGGIVTVDKPGDPLNGFQIEVPPGAYKEAKTFKISSAPIQNQTFGPDFNPISPLITIESGGEYSEEPMLVKIPVDVPEGYSAMAFFYNKETGTLEGMTTLGQERNCLITATTHFSQLVVEKVPHNILNEDVSSGFSPLTDCLGFPNYGSSITPGGNCAGHTITAIWYYRHMRSRAEYGSACRRFDKNGRKPETTHFPYDDSLGWRLVSTLQKDILLRWYSKTFQEDSRIHHQRTTGGSPDKETAMRFANAIRKTERPQMVHIISTSSTQDGSHAMVVYRVDKGTLYVYDPNYPGDTDRKIEFSEGKFKPYDSAARVGAPGKKYDLVVYRNPSDLVTDEQMRKRWNEFVGGNTGSTIGNDYFPAYKLYVTDSTGKKTELKDGFTAGTPQLMVQVEAPGSGGSSSSYKLGCEAYADTNSNPPKKVGIDAKGNWMLKPGKNQLGIWIFSLADNKAEYVDFKYIDVYYGSLVIVPDFKEPGPLNTPLKLYAKFQDENVPLPANVRYEWSTGTGKELGKGPANYVTVKSSTEGEFIVVVKLYDAAKNELLWEAQRAVQIKAQGTTPPPGPGIDLSKAEWCAFQAEYIISLVVEGETATSGFSTTEIFPDVMRGKIVGNTFTGQGKVKGTYGGSSDATITVTLDPSFKQVTSFRFSCSGADVVEGVDVQTNLEISGSNLPYLEPFNQGKGNGHRYGITGREACRHITTKMTQRLTHEGGTQTYPLKSFECNDASGVTIVLGWGD